MIYFEQKSEHLTSQDLQQGLFSALDKLGGKAKVLAVPPDMTRFYSRAGELTKFAWDYYGEALADILPALGTHAPMSDSELDKMYAGVPRELFRTHDWRNDVLAIGEVPSEFVQKVSDGAVDYPWPAQVNRMLVEGGHDLILSIGQVVPHEVAGMANFNKNIFIGTGGADGINKSHFLGAACDMEKIMGRAENPVRDVLNYASEHFSRELPPIVYVLTVIGQADDGSLETKGLFVGDDLECFHRAAELAADVDVNWLERRLDRVVVYLEPEEFKSTWLGNKAIYRTRMALADGGELTVIAPGVESFGEDSEIDQLIRKYGYRGTPRTLKDVEENDDLALNLSAAAHLIHGSSEGRFNITYAPGGLTREEIESVNFDYASLNEMLAKYDPESLRDGPNTVDGEEFYFISNPGLGLWAVSED